MSNYDDARATENTVLLPMSEEEAATLRSLLGWTTGGFTDDRRVVLLTAILERLRKLTPAVPERIRAF